MKACIPSNFPSSMVVHNALGRSVVELSLDSARVVQLGEASVMVDSSSFAVSVFFGRLANPLSSSPFSGTLQQAATTTASLTSSLPWCSHQRTDLPSAILSSAV